MCTVEEAKKMCPKLISQHVATWKEGDEKWAYHEDDVNIATHKVSLDPYRLESRKILAVIKDCLPADSQKVEKASSGQSHHYAVSRAVKLTDRVQSTRSS